MKKLLILLLLATSSFVRANQEDTTKIIQTHFSVKPDIAKKLFAAGVDGKFDSIAKFCTSSIDYFIAVKNQDPYYERMTEWKMITYLNDAIKQIPYTYFKVISGKNEMGDEAFVIEFYQKDSDTAPFAGFYFALDSKEAIRAVVIMVD